MKHTLTSGLLVAAIALCLWLLPAAMAQDCGIAGRVTDARRAAVATAIVTVTQVESGSRHQVLSNFQGFFQLAPVSAGEYRIEAVKPGFERVVGSGTALCPLSGATVDLQMENAKRSTVIALEARKTRDGSVLAYICGLSPGSGCETFALDESGSGLDATAVMAIVP